MTDVIDVSDSRAGVWNYCPESFGLTYIDGWQKKVKPSYFNKGSLFHEGVELALKTLGKTAGYAQKSKDELRLEFKAMKPTLDGFIDLKAQKIVDDNSATLTQEEVEDIEEQSLIARWMVGHYLYFLAEVLEHKVIVGIELKFEDDIHVTGFTKVRNRGIIDLLLYDVFENTVYVIDHKGAADLLNAEERLSHSLQLTGYCRYVQGLINARKALDVVGSEKVVLDLEKSVKIRPMLRVVRNKRPKEPKILKNGSVSAAAISTLKETYQAALDIVGEPVSEKQQARLDMLPEAWHTTVEPVISPADTVRWESEMAVVGQRMAEAEANPIYRTRNTRNCAECSLRNVCKLGDDPEFTKRDTENGA